MGFWRNTADGKWQRSQQHLRFIVTMETSRCVRWECVLCACIWRSERGGAKRLRCISVLQPIAADNGRFNAFGELIACWRTKDRASDILWVRTNENMTAFHVLRECSGSKRKGAKGMTVCTCAGPNGIVVNVNYVCMYVAWTNEKTSQETIASPLKRVKNEWKKWVNAKYAGILSATANTNRLQRNKYFWRSSFDTFKNSKFLCFLAFYNFDLSYRNPKPIANNINHDKIDKTTKWSNLRSLPLEHVMNSSSWNWNWTIN